MVGWLGKKNRIFVFVVTNFGTWGGKCTVRLPVPCGPISI